MRLTMILCVVAATRAANASAADPAIGTDAFYSTDADGTRIGRVGVNLDWDYQNPQHYIGVRLEKAWFRPQRQPTRSDDRAYVRIADDRGPWDWSLKAGTDGHTILGAASLNDTARWRKEFFVEREIVESPIGVTRRLYYTFAGGALDIPFGKNTNGTVVAAVQEFTGRNVRYHLRGNLIQTLDSRIGLTGQLRARYFHSTVPDEFDYYSPRDYVEILPLLQIRRTMNSGFRYLIAGGYGARRDTNSGWRAARFATAQISKVSRGRDLVFNLGVTYTNTPVGSGTTYSYTQFTAGITRPF